MTDDLRRQLDHQTAIAQRARRLVEQILHIGENDPIPDWALDCTRTLYNAQFNRVGPCLWELIFVIHVIEQDSESGVEHGS